MIFLEFQMILCGNNDISEERMVEGRIVCNGGSFVFFGNANDSRVDIMILGK